jgi:hypothetical protein
MIPVGGTFKYASDWYDPADLINIVVANYTGTARGKVQLVVSHGCRPFEEGAWCSPGYWRNASDGAWQLIGYTNKLNGLADLFNNTVVPDFYDTANANASLTIGTVLTDTGGPGGANKYGAASGPYSLNAFNAVGAYLTDQIPGFSFDPTRIGADDACNFYYVVLRIS